MYLCSEIEWRDELLAEIEGRRLSRGRLGPSLAHDSREAVSLQGTC